MPVAPSLLDPAHLRRRGGLLARRLARSVTGGLNAPCLFIHLPKCGGTSLTAGLAGTVPIHRRIGAVDALDTRRAAAVMMTGRDDLRICHEDLRNGARTFSVREAQMLAHMARGCPLIHGHLFFSPRALDTLGQDYRIVTMMRDPVARSLSNYRMAVRAGVIEDNLDRWLDGPVGARMAQAALRYLSGQNTIRDERRAMARAEEALNRIDLVGFLEDVPAFQDRFARLFGVRPAMPRLNVGAGDARPLTAGQAARLHDLTAPDRALYARARASRAAAVPERAKMLGSAPVIAMETRQPTP